MIAEKYPYPIVEFVEYERNPNSGLHSRVVYAKWFKDRKLTEVVRALSYEQLMYIANYITMEHLLPISDINIYGSKNAIEK